MQPGRPAAGLDVGASVGVSVLPGGSGDVGSDDIRGMPVHRGPGPVVSHRGPWISVRSGFLDISQRDPGVQGCGDERVPQRVRPDELNDPGLAGDAADDPSSAVPVQPAAIQGQEDRSVAAVADGQVDGPRRARRQWDGDDLATFAGDHQRAVPAFYAERLDVSAGGLGDPQPIQCEQRDQRMFAGWPKTRRDQQRAKSIFRCVRASRCAPSPPGASGSPCDVGGAARDEQ